MVLFRGLLEKQVERSSGPSHVWHANTSPPSVELWEVNLSGALVVLYGVVATNFF